MRLDRLVGRTERIEVSQQPLLTSSTYSRAHTSATSFPWPTASPLAGSDLVQGPFEGSRQIGPKFGGVAQQTKKFFYSGWTYVGLLNNLEYQLSYLFIPFFRPQSQFGSV